MQSEFQLDRADYLESIRRLEKNLKFYQQLIEKALPMLRRDGRFWDVDAIKADSEWNDDLEKWKLPESSMVKLKLPPAGRLFISFIIRLSFTPASSIRTSSPSSSLQQPSSILFTQYFQFVNTFILKWIQNNKMVEKKARHQQLQDDWNDHLINH